MNSTLRLPPNWKGWRKMPIISTAGIRDTVSARWLSLLIRLLLGGIFIVSGTAKLPLQMEFVEIVQSYNLLPDFIAIVYGFALPWVEFLVGCFLILGIQIRLVNFIVILMCLSFLVGNIGAAVTGDYYCPNCFGAFFSLTVSQAIAIDVFMLIASVILLFIASRREFIGFDSWFIHKFGNNTK
jgi:uncharacterized membrane protein YphA (DoxX/SURF4 family)